MSLLNLSLGEFFALFGALSGIVLTLYLLDRSRRRQVVATLRFWKPAEHPPEARNRRRIQQPWSLLLQILSICLLLLAIAQLQFGSRERSARDHIVILDTSAWMSARTGQITLADQSKALARAYVRSLPAEDRVMIVRADALPTPATPFESDRARIGQAIQDTTPGSAALDLNEALEFTSKVMRTRATRPGEVVFAGAGRIARHDADASTSMPRIDNLRVLPVTQVAENCGIRKIGLRRSMTADGVWQIFVAVRNYGRAPRQVSLGLRFGGAPAGSRTLTLPPDSEQNITFEYKTRVAGWLEARLLDRDDFAADNRAVLELPAMPLLKVAVFSDEPGLLRPVLASNPGVEARFLRTSQYDPGIDAQVIVLDRFRPVRLPAAAGTLWIEPPAAGSPVPVRTVVQNAPVISWNSDHQLGAGLHTKDLRLGSAQIFAASGTDVPIASVEAGPVIVARPGTPKLLVAGFHPMRSGMRYELATPLLFANMLHWMAPEVFRRTEIMAGSVGSIAHEFGSDVAASDVTLTGEGQEPIPFTIQGRQLRFFTLTPGIVRLKSPEGEAVYSLTLPEVGETRWEPPKTALRGIPRQFAGLAPATDIWPWLAVLGGMGLLAEWLLFGRARRSNFFGRAPARITSLAARLPWKNRTRGRPVRRAS